jgi:hypothetical protein
MGKALGLERGVGQPGENFEFHFCGPGQKRRRIYISIPVLEKVCKRHWGEGKRVSLSLEKVSSISGEGRDFLRKIHDRVTLLENPRFMGLKG